MSWEQVLTIVGSNIVFTLTLWLWNRAESRSDIRHMDIRLEATRELVHAIHLEIKDFHNRLCLIEEKNRGK